MSPKYKWATAHAWLTHWVRHALRGQLQWAVAQLAAKVDGDDIQDIFEAEMESDGFFMPAEFWKAPPEQED